MIKAPVLSSEVLTSVWLLGGATAPVLGALRIRRCPPGHGQKGSEGSIQESIIVRVYKGVNKAVKRGCRRVYRV